MAKPIVHGAKERPILFSGPMVRALLDGSKTQTRRIVKPGKWEHENAEYGFFPPCPYGQPGDRLWVKETYRFPDVFDADSPTVVGERCLDAGHRKPWAPIHYEADGARRDWRHTSTPPHGNVKPTLGKGRPSIHMPRWASRILLEIGSVRVERLNAISEEDARAEGCEQVGVETGQVDANSYPIEVGSYTVGYSELWESINGDGSWGTNPWVWAIEFKRVAA